MTPYAPAGGYRLHEVTGSGRLRGEMCWLHLFDAKKKLRRPESRALGL